MKMNLSQQLIPYPKKFPDYLASYIGQIREAIRLKKHHDQRRALFINYLRLAYDLDPSEFEIEEKVKVAAVRGLIDALYGYVIFEFKTDIDEEREVAKQELLKYFLSRSEPGEYISVLSDGLNFEVYQFERGKIVQISKFALSDDDAIASYRALDDILFVSKKTTPTSADIANRFGPHSAVFNKSRIALEDIFQRVSDDSSVKVKFTEWNRLLAKVYGEPIGDTSLFLRHTYLALFTRLLVLNALFPK
ncbi:MAG: hypothetical protein HRF51_04060, partial [bacterium]